MQQTAVRSAPIPTAAALEAEARKLGFVPGFPHSMPAAARLADLSAYRKAKCPACHSHVAVKPFHRHGPAGGYRLILACGVCGAGEIA